MTHEDSDRLEGLVDSTAASRHSLDRRRFLKLSAAGLAGATLVPLLNACAGQQPAPAKPAEGKPGEAAKAGPGGFAGGGSLKILVRSHFVPAYDTWLDKWGPEWGQKNRVEMAIDHILAAELPAKWAAEVAAGDGHDLFGFTQGGAINVYHQQLVDLSDLGKSLGDKYGWIEPLAPYIGQYEGVWKGIPDYFIEFGANYRKDLFDANNLKPVDTWDDLLKAGEVLKAQGSPIGIAINQRSNDANNSWHCCLWGYGVSYAKQDGKYAPFNTPETKEVVRFAVELYNKGMTDEVLSWDDTANNQGQLAGRISWIQNPISSLRTIEKEKPELARNIFVSNAPAGPKGRFTTVSTSVWGVMNWSKNVPAAKAFLEEYYANFTETVKASEGYNQPLLKEFRKKPMPIIGEDPKLQILQDFDQVARAAGHPGPVTPAAGEVESNWIIPLMIGRAIQGGNVDEAVERAASQIETIYKKHNMV
jgi:multiple sugar transport system substrate-binding protein